MNTARHITVASDFSAGAAVALARCVQLATDTGAQCELVHALGLDALAPLRAILGTQADEVSHKLVQDAQAQMDAHVLQADPDGRVAVTCKVATGLATDVIHAQALAAASDLVAVGWRGSSSWLNLLVGSTTSSLLRKSRLPVLVVKRPPDGPYRRVLVPVDFSQGSADALRLARAWAPQAHVVLVHVFDIPFEGKMRMAGVQEHVINDYRAAAHEQALLQLQGLVRELRNAGSDNTTQIVMQGEPAHQVLSQASHHDCDLIVMGKHGTHATQELLLGSVTRRVVANADCDVLVVVSDP